MLITSGDPHHHVQFEFGRRSVRYSGVYEGTPVTAVDILLEQIPSYDFTQNGSSFSGTLNASSLDPGYYIIRVSLDGGAIMDYVFEMTADGSAPLSWAELPADENLSAAASPLELPEEGVMQHITSSGDPETEGRSSAGSGSFPTRYARVSPVTMTSCAQFHSGYRGTCTTTRTPPKRE